MIVEMYPAGVFQTNCYIVGDEAAREGIIIDPGADADCIMRLAGRHGLDIKYIVLTHGHGDHIGAVAKIKGETGARVLMHVEDRYLTDGETATLIPILRNIQLFKADEYIKDGDIINFGGFRAEVIETPGHTPGSVSIKIEDSVFTGDALFQGSVGRTDFPKGSHEVLLNSIREKLMVLPDDTRIYPGHGPGTTIAREKKYNPFL